MTEIKKYSISSSNESTNQNSGAAKGTKDNPYTVEEYNSFADGTWPGGFVEGIGYVLADIVVVGSRSSSSSSSGSNSSDPWGSGSDPWGSNGSNPNGSGTGGGTTGGGTTGGGTTGGGTTGGGSGTTVIYSPDFSGYQKTDPRGCLNRCKEMLSAANCTLSGGEITMMNSDRNGRATTPTSDVSSGINYINSQLKMGHPVIVAVDYQPGTSMGSRKGDQAGDHFVIIVGGNSSSGYHYYDPATSNQIRGTSSNNIFRFTNNELKGTNICTGETHDYTVTGIRKNN